MKRLRLLIYCTVACFSIDALGQVKQTGWTTNRDPALARAAMGVTNAPTTVYYLSQAGAAMNANPTTGLGTDDAAVIQRLLDKATNGPVEVVIDGKALIGTTLRMRSNTRLRGLNQDCGFVLKTNVGCYMMTMHNQNGNGYSHSNVILQDLTFNGTSAFQPHEVAPTAPDFDGDKIGPLNPVDLTSQQDAYLMAIWFAGVRGLTIERVKVIDAKCFAITLGGCVRAARVRDCEAWWHDNLINGEGNQDGVHMYGPWDDVVIENFKSNGDDDRVALNTDENSYCTNAIFSVMRGTNNGASGVVTLDGLQCDRSADGAICGGGIRLLSFYSASNRCYITNLTIRNVKGEISGSTIIRGIINSRYVGYTLKGDNLLISDISCEGDDSGAVDLEVVDYKFVTIENLSMSRTFPSPSTDTTRRWADPYVLAWIESKNIHLRNVRIQTPAGTTNAVLFQLRSDGDINLTMSDCYFSGPGIRAWVEVGDSSATLMNFRAYGLITTNANVPLVISDLGVIGPYVTEQGTNTVKDFDTSIWKLNAENTAGNISSNTLAPVDSFMRTVESQGDLARIYEMGMFAGVTNFPIALTKLLYQRTNTYFLTNSGLTTLRSNGGFAGIHGDYGHFLNTGIPLTNLASFRSNFVMGVWVTTNTAPENHMMGDIGSSVGPPGDTTRLGIVNHENSSTPSATPFLALGNLYPVCDSLTNHGLICMAISNDVVRAYVNGTNAPVSGPSSGWNGEGFVPTGYLHVFNVNGYYSSNVVAFYFLASGGTNAATWLPRFSTNVSDLMTNFNAKNF